MNDWCRNAVNFRPIFKIENLEVQKTFLLVNEPPRIKMSPEFKALVGVKCTSLDCVFSKNANKQKSPDLQAFLSVAFSLV